MSEAIINAKTREGIRKKNMKLLRREGYVPGIFYAHDEKNIKLQFEKKELQQILGLKTALLDLSIDKKKPRKCIIRELQIDPVTMQLVHVDVMGVKLKEKINVSVPIHIVGEAPGVKTQGGILSHALHEVEISCLPLDLPDHIDIDISQLGIGQSIHVGDIKLENIDIITDPEVVIVSVTLARVTTQADTEKPTEAAEAAEGKAEQTKE
jgi:large subunit ribosomal protein L25